MGDADQETRLQARLRRPTGVALALVTLPLGLFGVITLAKFGWSIARELYCRHFYQNSPILCYYIGYDFRIDLLFIVIGVLVLYPLVHLVSLRKLPLKRHALLILGIALMGIAMSSIVPSLIATWEGWLT